MHQNFSREQKVIGWIYGILVFMMCLTGFGQMPIFKRYYIADIPGLAWLANFYVTHYMHYVGAILLFALSAYCITAYLLVGKNRFRLTKAAYARIILLTAIGITGIFRVLKNFPDIVFSPNFTMFIDISHLVFMMVFLMATAAFALMKSGWLVSKM